MLQFLPILGLGAEGRKGRRTLTWRLLRLAPKHRIHRTHPAGLFLQRRARGLIFHRVVSWPDPISLALVE